MRLRVLLSAFFCSPYKGGESAVGWNTAVELAKHHDVTVLCGDLSASEPTGEDIAKYTREQGLPPGLEVKHVLAGKSARLVHDLHALPGLWFLYYKAYASWQREALAVARELHAANPFDVVHHVTVIGFREPGYLWQLGVPFFWGPVSGSPMVPVPFIADFGWKEQLRWRVRNFFNRLQMDRGGRPAQAARAATRIWAVCREDREMFARWGVKAEPMLEVGAQSDVGQPKTRQLENGQPLKVCWSGLFQGIKALPVLLAALAQTKKGSVEVDVLGDGVEAERWKSLARSLEVEDRVTWHGMLPRDKALEVMDRCHVLAHTSIKEATATVVLEALERGLPVLCHDACGMGTAVTGDCGLKVPLVDFQTSASGFGQALSRLIQEPGLLSTLSQGAVCRAEELTWRSKATEISQAYEQACAGKINR